MAVLDENLLANLTLAPAKFARKCTVHRTQPFGNLGEMYMHPVLVLNERIENKATSKSGQAEHKSPDIKSVLIATVDHEIRAALTELLESANLEAIWVSSVKAAKTLLSNKKISACLCGFWLQDGTYREVVRHLRRERMDIPAVIVSAAACPREFRDYLAAMNLGSLEVMSYPFERSDFDRILEFAIPSSSASQVEASVIAMPQLEVRGAA
jgi:CheY-like chemotaxis protein